MSEQPKDKQNTAPLAFLSWTELVYCLAKERNADIDRVNQIVVELSRRTTVAKVERDSGPTGPIQMLPAEKPINFV